MAVLTWSRLDLPMSTPIRAKRNALGISYPGGDHVYVVVWPDGVVKAGIAFHWSRWVAFLSRGAQLASLFSSEEYAIDGLEDRLHALLSDGGPRAFAHPGEARPYLGNSGGGYSECWRLDQPALDQFLGAVAEIGKELRQWR